MAPASLSDVHGHHQSSIGTRPALPPPPLYPLSTLLTSSTHRHHHASPTYIEDKTTSASPSAIFSSTFEDGEEEEDGDDDEEELHCASTSKSETAVRKLENTALDAGSSKHSLSKHNEACECGCECGSTDVNSHASNTSAPSSRSNKTTETQQVVEELKSRAEMKRRTTTRRHATSDSNTCTCTAHLHVDESGPSSDSAFRQDGKAERGQDYAIASAAGVTNGFGVTGCALSSESHYPLSSSSSTQHTTSDRTQVDQQQQQQRSESSTRTSAAHPGLRSGLALYDRPEATLYDRRQKQMQLSQQQRQQDQDWQQDHVQLPHNVTTSHETKPSSTSTSCCDEAAAPLNLFRAPPPAAGLGLLQDGQLSSCPVSQRDQSWRSSEDLQVHQQQQQRLGSRTTGDTLQQSSSVNPAGPSSSTSTSTTALVTSPRTSSLPSSSSKVTTTECYMQQTSRPHQQYAKPPVLKSNLTPRASTAPGTSSAVKANSPLRIITTPLPTLTDPDSGGTVAVAAPRQAAAPSSSSSPTDQAGCAPRLSVTNASMSSSGSSSNEDIPTPTASPYSSSYTSSSFPSSVPPTTAGTSYPTSANCYVHSTSTCNTIAEGVIPSEYAHGSTKDSAPPSTSRNTRPRSNTAIARSRYSDFASSNTSNYEWFNTVCPSDSRPPLLRSVSEDTPVYQQQQHNQTTNMSSSTLADSQNRLVQAALYSHQHGQQSQHHNHNEAHEQPGNRHESLPMGQRALTAPFAYKNDPSTSVSVPEEDDSNPTFSPPSERSSSRYASASISSQSSVSTAASSKRSSWCSPPTDIEALPPLAVDTSGRSTPYDHGQAKNPQKPSTSAFKPRHSASYSVSAAVPLTRANGIHQRASGADSRTTFNVTTTSSSAPSSNVGLHEEYGYATERDASQFLATLDPAVAEAIRQAAASVRAQTGHVGGSGGGISASQQQQRIAPAHTAKHGQSIATAAADVNMSSMQNSLMGACGNGYFGNAIRAKALEILDELLPSIACGIEEDEVIGIAEYGSLNSLSSSLVPCITSHFSAACATGDEQGGAVPSFSVTYSDGPGADFRPLMRQVDSTSYEYPHHHLNPQVYSFFAARPFAAQIVPRNSITVGMSLMDLHCRRTPASTGLSAAAAAHNELQAFLTSRAREIKKGGLLLVAFIQRQEDDSTMAVAAGRSKRAGDQESPDEPNFTSPIGSSTLQCLPGLSMSDRRSFPLPSALTPFPPFTAVDSPSPSMQSLSCSLDSSSSTATSLSSPSMSRRRSESSPCKPCFKTEQAARRTEIWSTIPSLLAPCIQRLVSTGLIKSDTASHLLTLPLHPRTPSQTRAVLRAVQHQWRTEWACGLPEPSLESSGAVSPSTPTPTSSFAQHATMPETLHAKLDGANASRQRPSYARQGPIREEALLLSHPAYTAYQSTTLSRVQFAEHALQFIRVLYDTHFRTVLHDYAKLSRSRLEEVLDALNEVLREKIEEPGRALLALELEVCMVALRRV